jgi:hypothetical protein
MLAPVAAQLAILREGLVTPLTGKRSLPGVHTLVLKKTAFQRERTTTLTLVRLFTRVRALVCDEVAAHRKLFKTLSTLIWFFAGVYSHVGSQTTALGERLVALYAREGFIPAMGSLMLFKCSFLCERLGANITDVRFFRAMDSNMGLEVAVAREGLAAMVADEGSISGMCSLMHLQSVRAFECFPAE